MRKSREEIIEDALPQVRTNNLEILREDQSRESSQLIIITKISELVKNQN